MVHSHRILLPYGFGHPGEFTAWDSFVAVAVNPHGAKKALNNFFIEEKVLKKLIKISISL